MADEYALEGIPAREFLEANTLNILVDYMRGSGRYDMSDTSQALKTATRLSVAAEGGTVNHTMPVTDLIIAYAIGCGLRAGGTAIDGGEDPQSARTDAMEGLLSLAKREDESATVAADVARSVVVSYLDVVAASYREHASER